MKRKFSRILGLVLMIVAGIVAIFMTLAVVVVTSANEPPFEGSAFSNIFTLLILFIPLAILFIYGRKLFRGNGRTTKVPISQIEDFTIALKVKIDQPEFVRLSLRILYAKRVMLMMTAMGILMALFYAQLYLSEDAALENKLSHLPVIFIFFFLVILPGMAYFEARKQYARNKQIREQITYTFNHEEINIMGESFEYRTEWSLIRSAKEMKGWFILFTSPIQFLPLPKRAFQSASEEDAFRKLLRSKEGIKLNLKDR